MTRETIQYKDLSVRDPAPYGAAGAAWQANFKALADRIGPCNFTATASPTVNDDTGDGYATGSLWYDTAAQRVYWCASAATGAAVWIEISSSATAAITGGTITGITDLAVADGGTGASDAATARTNLGLGTIATQAANSVAITGGAIDGTAIGATTPSTVKATTLETTGAMGLGGAPVAGYPATLYQPADLTGLKVFGYDDRSGDYVQLGLGAYGNAYLVTNGYLEIQPSTGKATYLNGAAAGNVILFFGTTANQALQIYGYDAGDTAAKSGRIFVATDGSLFVNAPSSEKLALGTYGGTLATVAPTGELSIPSDTVGLKLDAAGTTTLISNGTVTTLNKPLKATAYQSSDGTAGATADVAVAKVGGGTRTLSFKNGLYTGYTDS